MTQPTLMAQLVELQEENARLREEVERLIATGIGEQMRLVANDECEACAKILEMLISNDDRGLLNHNLLTDAAALIRARKEQK